MAGRTDGLEPTSEPSEIGERFVDIEDGDGGRIWHTRHLPDQNDRKTLGNPCCDARRVTTSGGASAPRFDPDWEHTVHCLGDLHAGAITDVRLNAVRRDIERLSAPALHLQIGDATERGTEAQDKLALGFLKHLPGPWVAALGNHDILHNERRRADWARVYGQPSQNFTVDLGFVRVVVIGPSRTEPGRRAGRLSIATLSFLERELADAATDCWIACHWPLFGTVMGDPRLHFTSTMPAFHAKPDEAIRDVLRRHPNAKLWISGHTHSPLSAPGLIKRVRLAPRRSLVAINTSALVGIGRRRDPRAPLCSLYLTHRPGALEIRARDHRNGRWRNLRGRPVVKVSL
jgi:3',5'-cyclic AMP phosphodiesterase CpdA